MKLFWVPVRGAQSSGMRSRAVVATLSSGAFRLVLVRADDARGAMQRAAVEYGDAVQGAAEVRP